MTPMTAAPESNPCFSLELALRIDSAGRKRLDRDFDFGRQLVNATLGTALGRRTQMRQTPEWKAACDWTARAVSATISRRRTEVIMTDSEVGVKRPLYRVSCGGIGV